MSRKPGVLIDTDVFLIDLCYSRDSKYLDNKLFLKHVRDTKFTGWTTIYNVMEICGILSFNLSPQSLQELFIGFAVKFNVNILFPEDEKEKVCFAPAQILEVMQYRLSFGDALIVELAQEHARNIDFVVSWNAAHFQGKFPARACMPNQMK